MAQDSARSVFMKRKFANFARRPDSAASGVCLWKILLTICTKQNHEVACRSVGFLFGSARQARRKVFTNTQPPVRRVPNLIGKKTGTNWASKNYESEIGDRLCFSDHGLGERYQRRIRTGNVLRNSI